MKRKNTNWWSQQHCLSKLTEPKNSTTMGHSPQDELKSEQDKQWNKSIWRRPENCLKHGV